MAMRSLSMDGFSRLPNLWLTALVMVAFASFARSEEPTSNYAQQPAGEQLPEDVVDAVWKAIDANQDGRATDRESYDAIKPVRVAANSKK